VESPEVDPAPDATRPVAAASTAPTHPCRVMSPTSRIVHQDIQSDPTSTNGITPLRAGFALESSARPSTLPLQRSRSGPREASASAFRSGGRGQLQFRSASAMAIRCVLRPRDHDHTSFMSINCAMTSRTPPHSSSRAGDCTPRPGIKGVSMSRARSCGPPRPDLPIEGRDDRR